MLSCTLPRDGTLATASRVRAFVWTFKIVSVDVVSTLHEGLRVSPEQRRVPELDTGSVVRVHTCALLTRSLVQLFSVVCNVLPRVKYVLLSEASAGIGVFALL